MYVKCIRAETENIVTYRIEHLQAKKRRLTVTGK